MSGSPATPAPARGLDRSRVPEAGPLREFHFPAVQRRVLSNGSPLVVSEVRRFPVVTVHTLLEAGGVREPSEIAGIGSLTAALLESGAGGRGAGEIAEDLEALGVQLETGTTWDSVHSSLTCLRSSLPPAAEILADLVREPRFPQHEVERLRAERLASILQRRADPRTLATEAAARFIYAEETAFARPLAGSTETVGRITRNDVVTFHTQHYRAGGATFILTGDVSADEALELMEARFGTWIGAVETLTSPAVRARSQDPQVVVVDRPGAVQSEIRVGHLGVRRSVEDYFAITVLNTILGGAFSSRLNLNLRERQGFTYGASSSFAMRRQQGSFLVSTAVQTEVTAAAVREIMVELHAIRERPAAAAELEDARNYLAGVFPLRLQTTEGVAARLAEIAIHDLPADYFETYRSRVLEVSAAAVHAAAQRYLLPDRAAVVIVGDAARIREPLAELGIAPVQVVDPAAL